eukprot:7756953-Pyramimonas_sp.AAC.2
MHANFTHLGILRAGDDGRVTRSDGRLRTLPAKKATAPSEAQARCTTSSRCSLGMLQVMIYCARRSQEGLRSPGYVGRRVCPPSDS